MYVYFLNPKFLAKFARSKSICPFFFRIQIGKNVVTQSEQALDNQFYSIFICCVEPTKRLIMIAKGHIAHK